MAQIRKLKDYGTNKTIYPITSAQAVFFADGASLQTKFTAGIPIVRQTASTVTIKPAVLNVWGTMDSLTINFEQGENGYAFEYYIEFVSGATPTVLTLPGSVQFPEVLKIKANRKYFIRIMHDIGVVTSIELIGIELGEEEDNEDEWA